MEQSMTGAAEYEPGINDRLLRLILVKPCLEVTDILRRCDNCMGSECPGKIPVGIVFVNAAFDPCGALALPGCLPLLQKPNLKKLC